MFVNGKEIYTFKANNGNVDFPTQFCLGNISNNFSFIESKEVCLKGIVYVTATGLEPIAVDNILDIHKYSMKKNGIV